MFLNLQVTRTNGTTAPAVYTFDTVEAARANHHYFLSSSYGNSALEYFLGEIVDEQGLTVDREMWAAPEPEPEPDPEPEPEPEPEVNEE